MANPYYITDQVCACGCDTRMPSTLVDRGWQYLRGHKPAHLKPVPAKTKRVAERPVMLAKKTFSYADAKALADAEAPMLEEQREHLIAERDRAEAALEAVNDRLHWIASLQTAAQSLTPQRDAEARA